MTRAVHSEPLTLAGPAGELEAAADLPQGSPRAVAVVCHPHPQQQGTMENKVVTTLARAFARLGAVALRFNFRGVGRSAGMYADGSGERDDVIAVTHFARTRWPGLSLYLGGFSFGAAVALTATTSVEPRGLVTVAPPIARLPATFVPPRCRWLLVHGMADEVVPPQPVVEWARALARPPQLVLLDGVGHFFHGKLKTLDDAVTEFFGAELGGVQSAAS